MSDRRPGTDEEINAAELVVQCVQEFFDSILKGSYKEHPDVIKAFLGRYKTGKIGLRAKIDMQEGKTPEIRFYETQEGEPARQICDAVVDKSSQKPGGKPELYLASTRTLN